MEAPTTAQISTAAAATAIHRFLALDNIAARCSMRG